MSRGAYCLAPAFLDPLRLRAWVDALRASDWSPTRPDRGEAWEPWREVRLFNAQGAAEVVQRLDGLGEFLQAFPCKVRRAMFYGLAPGGEIPAHRDVNGARALGRLRLHVPAVTHPDVDFRIGGRSVSMRPGELWALDTSWRHSVHNRSHIERVHLVLNVELGPWLLERLARPGLEEWAHRVTLMGVLGGKLVVTAVNGTWRMNAARFMAVARGVARRSPRA